MGLIDVALSAWDNFLNRRGFGVPATRRVSYRMLQPVQPQKRPIAFFGSDPTGFGEDWAYRTAAKVTGPATNPQKLQDDLKTVEPDLDAPLVLNTSIPQLTAHGKNLDYSRNTDQRVVAHDFTPSDKEITLGGGVEPRKSFLTSARTHEKTVADKIAEEWNKTETYDFRG
jgi:hypothetical protein